MALETNIEVTNNQIFKWKFNLIDKAFDFDPLLPEFLGFPANKKISLAHLFSSFDGDQTTEVSSAFKNVLATKERFERLALINASEKRFLVKISISLVEGIDSVVEGEVEYLQQFPSTADENALFRKIFINSESGRMMATSDHTIIMANKVFCDELGYQEDELIGKNARILKSGYYAPEFYKKLWDTVNTVKIWRGELLAINKQKEVYAREVKIERFELDDGDHFYFANSVKLDVPSSVLEEHISCEDNASSIPDKIQYIKSLTKSYEKLGTEQSIVVATFNLNWLQKISDFTANWLISQRFQLANHPGKLGTISKGIYSIYWLEDKNPDKIDSLLRQLLKTYSFGFDDSGFDLFSTISIGVSILGVDAKNPAQLVSHSTQTLIANPTREHSSLYYFDRRLSNRFDKHQVLAKLLREALNEKKVDVSYQPIVAIPSLEIKEFEALFRMSLDTEIEYNTQELINIAESHNWIDEIDEIVTKIALQALPKLQRHYKNKDIAIAVNRSLANDRVSHCCLEDTIDILLASKVNLKNVTIELTESAIFENVDQQKQWVEKLREHGVNIAIDDFGTGYSSFAYLNNLPINFIKIDRSFVTGISVDSNEYAMIEMLCKLAHKIGAKVIAEGVEEIDELTVLSRANVDMLQGYIFSKPMSLTEILSKPAEPYPQAIAQVLKLSHNPTLRDIYNKKFITVEFDDRLSRIKKELEIQPQNHFIVIEDKKCVGVLYTHDYYSSISPYIGTKGEQKRDILTLGKRVHQVMDKDFYSLNIESDLALAEQIFSLNPYCLIVVTNHQDHCLGIVTIQELMSYNQLKKDKESEE